jgi:hypothetical protein
VRVSARDAIGDSINVAKTSEHVAASAIGVWYADAMIPVA